MSYPRLARLLALPAVIGAYVGLTPGLALAATTCSFSSGAVTVTVEADATLSRTAEGAIQVNGVNCGAATVTNTDTVTINGTAPGATLTLDLGNGPLEPGVTAETSGAPEIEILWDAAGLALAILGTAGSDKYVRDTWDGGINLNEPLEPLDRDSDIVFDSPPTQLVVSTWWGEDFVDLRSPEGMDVWPQTIYTGDERDVVYGGTGADTIDSGGGLDLVVPGPGGDDVNLGAQGGLVDASADSAPDTYDPGSATGGSTWISYGGNADIRLSLDGVANDGATGEGDNVYPGFETIETSGGNDVVVGSPGAEYIQVSSGEDFVDGGGGLDRIYGSLGEDTVSFASSSVGVSVDLQAGTGSSLSSINGFESVIGSPFNDQISTTQEHDTVRPGLGADVVNTRGGEDIVIAEPSADGADVWSLGAGVDTVDYSLRTLPLSLTLDTTANDGSAGEADNLLPGAEIVLGGTAADVLVGDRDPNTFFGNAGNDTLAGRGGADVLDGDAGDDSVSGSSGDDTLVGDVGNDSLNGSDGEDRLLGGAGNDSLRGGPGDDDEYGEAGNDRFVQGDTTGDNGSDLLVGGADTDTVSYSGRSGGVTVTVDGQFNDGAAFEHDNVAGDVNVVEGTASADLMTGSSAGETLRGLGGNDRLVGLGGSDLLDGGVGNDSFAEGATASGRDTFIGGAGVDLADYSLRIAAVRVDLDNAADDGATGEADNVRSDVENISGGAGSDVIIGSSTANRLVGGAGNDSITGGTGADALDGGSGNDTLYAKDGVKDTLVGGPGTDRATRDTVDAVSSVESFV